MALLLYKSNEMFSSTELIRKSKMIFDKILEKEIEKAIILRDGKPSFLLMEFAKYEKIMAEYEELKEYVARIEESTVPKKKKKKKIKTQEDHKLKDELVKGSEKIAIPKMDYVKDIVAKKKTEIEKVVEKNEPQPKENVIEDIKAKSSEPEEISKLNQEEIKAKILQARKEREALVAQEQEENPKEDILEKQIEEEKLKKEQELEEFWD